MGKYLREGEWCKCERSCNSRTGGFENGVSVHECKEAGSEKWQGKGDAFDNHGILLVKRSHWYLVEGDLQDNTGADGEPLLKNVKALIRLKWDDCEELFRQESSVLEDVEPRFHPGYERGECRCQKEDDILREAGYDI